MKTKEEILEQLYVSAKDLKILIPTIGINGAKKAIKEIQEEMKEKGYFVPETKTLLALTKLVKKRFGF